MHRSTLFGSICLVVALGLSLVIAFEINGFLGLSMSDKELPDVPVAAALLDTKPKHPHLPGKKLPLRIADFGSVGVVPDAENWGHDYSHNLRHLEKAILPDPPYIDTAHFDQAASEFRAYVDLLAANDINGLIVPFMLELINFDLVEDGYAVYGEYKINLFDVLAAYRTYFLNYYAWIVSGEAAAYAAWNESLPVFLDKEEIHTRTYGHNLDFPGISSGPASGSAWRWWSAPFSSCYSPM